MSIAFIQFLRPFTWINIVDFGMKLFWFDSYLVQLNNKPIQEILLGFGMGLWFKIKTNRVWKEIWDAVGIKCLNKMAINLYFFCPLMKNSVIKNFWRTLVIRVNISY